MPKPAHADCPQQPIVHRFEEELREFRQEFREGQAKQIEILEGIARQGERLGSFQVQLDKQDKSLNEAFSRIRDLELQPGEEAMQKVKESVSRHNRKEDNIFLVKLSGVITVIGSIVIVIVEKVS